MQFIEESENIEDDNSYLSAANRPKESKLSTNCLLSNKGNVKECDRKLLSSSNSNKVYKEQLIMIESKNYDLSSCTKIQNCKDHIDEREIGINCDSIIEIRVNLTKRVSPLNKMYKCQRKLSSYIILADMLDSNGYDL